MIQLFRPSPNAGFMLQRMPENVRVTFTPHQIQAVESALIVRPHAVDMRLTIPFFGRGAYVVIIAGGERRRIARGSRQQSAAQGGSAHAIRQLSETFPHASRLLGKMPEELAASFTPLQISAMDSVLIPRTHTIDLRLSLPIFGQEFYAACLAGRNRRTYYRDLQNRNSFVMPMACASVAISAIAIFTLVHLKDSALLTEPDPLVSAESTFYPTVVPFKKNREECERSDRQWIDDQCIDTVHDPAF
ncbi:MAG: hypothetical protein WBB01_04970 [Phormidesmis sp.]